MYHASRSLPVRSLYYKYPRNTSSMAGRYPACSMEPYAMHETAYRPEESRVHGLSARCRSPFSLVNSGRFVHLLRALRATTPPGGRRGKLRTLNTAHYCGCVEVEPHSVLLAGKLTDQELFSRTLFLWREINFGWEFCISSSTYPCFQRKCIFKLYKI